MSRRSLPRQQSKSRDLTHVMCLQARPSCALSCPSGLPRPDGRSGSSAGWILRWRPPLRVRDANGVNGRRSPWSDGSSAEMGGSRPESRWPANKHVDASRSMQECQQRVDAGCVCKWSRCCCNACRCGRCRQSLGGRVVCCDEGRRACETGTAWAERRGGASRITARRRKQQARRWRQGYRWRALDEDAARWWCRWCWGRAAVVSERSSSEMAGQQLPSASARPSTSTRMLPPLPQSIASAPVRACPRPAGLSSNSAVLAVPAVPPSRSARQADHLRCACHSICACPMHAVFSVQYRYILSTTAYTTTYTATALACSPVRARLICAAWSRTLLYLHASQARTLCSQMIICPAQAFALLRISLSLPAGWHRPWMGYEE